MTNLLLHPPFSFQRLSNLSKSRRLQERQAEDNTLAAMELATIGCGTVSQFNTFSLPDPLIQSAFTPVSTIATLSVSSSSGQLCCYSISSSNRRLSCHSISSSNGQLFCPSKSSSNGQLFCHSFFNGRLFCHSISSSNGRLFNHSISSFNGRLFCHKTLTIQVKS